MTKEKTTKRVLFIILVTFLSIVMFALLEFNKNTLLGFILLALVVAGFVVVYSKFIKDKKWYLKLTVFLIWLILFTIIFFVTWPPYDYVKAYLGSKPEYTSELTINDGVIKGVYNEDKTVEIYAGIPYASPPVGENRWKAPQDPEKWDNVRECDHFMPMSMQPTNSAIYDSLAKIIGYHDYKISFTDNYLPYVSEDSLYLNVWKPAGNCENLPVLVYIHGGSLQTGQTWFEDYSGENLAKEDVIVVNMAYRLGVFGYYANEELALEDENGSTGNYGMLDQIKALEWVRDNIEYFGGDKDNVTLSGESAGSACVSALCVSPLAKGLFENVVLESSTVAGPNPPHSYRLYDEAIQSGKSLMDRYNCSSVADLRKLDAKTLVGEANTQHHITIDGYFLPDTPYNLYKKGEFNETTVLHGYNLKESGPFLIFDSTTLSNYENKVRGFFGDYADDILDIYNPDTNDKASEYWAEIYGAVFFDYPHYCLNRLEIENNVNVYEYIFTKSNGRLGSWHSGEEIYLYRNIPDNSNLFTSRDRELSIQMSSYLLNLMKTGNPNGSNLPTWEINKDSLSLLEFGDKTEMVKERKIALYDILDKMFEWQ